MKAATRRAVSERLGTCRVTARGYPLRYVRRGTDMYISFAGLNRRALRWIFKGSEDKLEAKTLYEIS